MSEAAQRRRVRRSLARWLGPWTPAVQAPRDVIRQERSLEMADGRTLRARYYLPKGRAPVGAILVSHGIHYLGATDPRFDRFCRVLATSGLAVMAPLLVDYIRLEPRPRLIPDVLRGYDLLVQQPEIRPSWRPGVFSISFGSLLALRLAAHPDYAQRIGAAVLFGGYADWSGTMRYMINGAVDGQAADDQRNPLNRPVVFINLLPNMPDKPSDPAALIEAWKRYVRRVWPFPEMKELENRRPIIERIAKTVADDARERFLQGCGLAEGGDEIVLNALEDADHFRSFLDPRAHLGPLVCPITAVHGVADDVIHHTQLEVLAEAMPPDADITLLRTGLYSHANSEASLGLQAIAREISVLLQTLDGIVSAGMTRAP
ncbi:MAG: hypothetical protein AAFV53_18585 [Myxococcota bacterium]